MKTKHTASVGIVVLLLAGLISMTGCQKKEAAPQSDQTETTQQREAFSRATDGTTMIGPLTAVVPENWESRAPATSMRMGEFLVHGTEEQSLPGLITVFYLGPEAGSVEMNIERWVGQFSQSSGEPLTPELITEDIFDSNGLEITMVSFKGTQKPSSMPGGMNMHEMKNFVNLSGIVKTPVGPWFFKGTGPETLMEQNQAPFEAFLRSMTYEAPKGH